LLDRRDFIRRSALLGGAAAWPEIFLGASRPLQRRLEMSFDGRRRTRWLENQRGGCGVAGQELRFADLSFSLVLDGKTLTAADFSLVRRQDQTAGGIARHTVSYESNGLRVRVALEWSDQRPEVRKWLEVTNTGARPVRLQEVNLEVLSLPAGTAVDIEQSKVTAQRVLARTSEIGLMLALDFACCRVRRDGPLLELGYRPHAELAAGETHHSHSALSSPVDLKGERPGYLFRRIIASRFPFPFAGPLNLYYPITNQWYYSPPNLGETAAEISPYQGNPGVPMLHTDPEGVMHHMELAQKLGLTHVLLYPAADRLAPGKVSPDVIERVVRHGHDLGLRVVACATFNAFTYWGFYAQLGEDARALQAEYKDEWFWRDGEGKKQAGICPGCSEFVAWAGNRASEFVRRFAIDGWLVDGAGVQQCWADHGHLPGEESLYAQVHGWADYYQQVLSTRPQMAGMCNLGFEPMLPQFVQYLHSIYLTDPLNLVVTPSLSELQMMADSRRKQAVQLLEQNGVPAENNQNAEYYLIRDSPLRQEKTFEYSLLQGLAVSPNLSVADLEGLLDEVPARSIERVQLFWKKWTSFAQENFLALRSFRRVGEVPGLGRLEVYEKCDGKQSLLFVINPSPIPLTKQFRLADLISIPGATFSVQELYPTEIWYPGLRGREWRLEDTLVLGGEPDSLTLLRVSSFVNGPVVSGAPATLEVRKEDWELTVYGRTGEAALAYLDSPIASVEVVPPPVVRVEGKVSAEVVEETNGVLRIQFPGRATPQFISHWQAATGSLETALAGKWYQRMVAPVHVLPASPFFGLAHNDRLEELPPGNRFLGVRLYNLPSSEEQVRLRLVLKRGQASILGRTPQAILSSASDFVGEGGSWWYQGQFYLPFAFSREYRPGPEDHLLALPVLTVYEAVRRARAWLNGDEIELEKHQYRRYYARVEKRLGRKGRDGWCYFMNLTKAGAQLGENTLTFWFEWGD
jgi:hypothetical protein